MRRIASSRLIPLLLLLALVFSCQPQKEEQKAEAPPPSPDPSKALRVEMTVSLDGEPASGSLVEIDGAEAGRTDEKGGFASELKRIPGSEVKLAVKTEREGYRVDPWEGGFVMKLPAEEGKPDTYAVQVDLRATRWTAFQVGEPEGPVAGAALSIDGKAVGETGPDGSFIYEFGAEPKKPLKVRVAKKGYSVWEKPVELKAGDRVEVALSRIRVPVSREAKLTVQALTEEYGAVRGVADVQVLIDQAPAGKTDGKGEFVYTAKAKPGQKVELSLVALGHVPIEWIGTVELKGKTTLTRYFYSTRVKPVRVGLLGHVNNTPDLDLGESLTRLDEALGNNLFIYPSFRKVKREDLLAGITAGELSVDRMMTEGWKDTSLARQVDMIVSGSVLKDARGLTIETKVVARGGRTLLSQIHTAKNDKDLPRAAKEIAQAVLDRFPFEGSITQVEDDRYRINLGKTDHRIQEGNEFGVLLAELDADGRATGYREAGTLRVKRVEQDASWAEALDLKEGAGRGDRALDLPPVADDPGILQQALHLAGIESGDPGRIELRERPAVALTLLEDGRPAQAGLGAIQHEELEVPEVVMHRHPPLLIVIGDHELVLPRPGTANTRTRHRLLP